MKKKILLFILLFVLLIASFLTGGFLGFNQGFSNAMVSSVNEATMAMSVIKRLNENKNEEAINILNTLLDSHILTYDNAKFADDFLIPFSPVLFILEKEKFDNNMKKVLLYRKENPSNNEKINSYIIEISENINEITSH